MQAVRVALPQVQPLAAKDLSRLVLSLTRGPSGEAAIRALRRSGVPQQQHRQWDLVLAARQSP